MPIIQILCVISALMKADILFTQHMHRGNNTISKFDDIAHLNTEFIYTDLHNGPIKLSHHVFADNGFVHFGTTQNLQCIFQCDKYVIHVNPAINTGCDLQCLQSVLKLRVCDLSGIYTVTVCTWLHI